MNEPLAIEGFYYTRLAARRLIRSAGWVALIAASAALGSAVIVLGVADFLLVYGGVSW
jgi:hypothetical protein